MRALLFINRPVIALFGALLFRSKAAKSLKPSFALVLRHTQAVDGPSESTMSGEWDDHHYPIATPHQMQNRHPYGKTALWVQTNSGFLQK